MFTIEALIALLQRQKPGTELRDLQAASTDRGLEISGSTSDGKSFRIVSSPRPKPAK